MSRAFVLLLMLIACTFCNANSYQGISKKGCRNPGRRGCKGFPIADEPFNIYSGESQESCCCLQLIGLCPRNYSPVCGTDGVSYGNKCTLCAAKGRRQYMKDRSNPLKIHHLGKCRSKRQRYYYGKER
ncbi:serine protease inhibitor Kazal-type 6-like [Styela clava]|uniref:serine protease inhibitor Kazal-type 6-like n=1 Tax=Styela clava TaxID=7725 RepID=UPI00193A4EB3|nr:serine protease inhibitor Kazal-type 6-like [Styela clava]